MNKISQYMSSLASTIQINRSGSIKRGSVEVYLSYQWFDFLYIIYIGVGRFRILGGGKV